MYRFMDPRDPNKSNFTRLEDADDHTEVGSLTGSTLVVVVGVDGAETKAEPLGTNILVTARPFGSFKLSTTSFRDEDDSGTPKITTEILGITNSIDMWCVKPKSAMNQPTLVVGLGAAKTHRRRRVSESHLGRHSLDRHRL